jgi:hypothetical protein
VLIVNKNTTYSKQSTYEPTRTSSSVRLLSVHLHSSLQYIPHAATISQTHFGTMLFFHSLLFATRIYFSLYIAHIHIHVILSTVRKEDQAHNFFHNFITGISVYDTMIRAFNTQNVCIKKWNRTPYFLISAEKFERVVTLVADHSSRAV